MILTKSQKAFFEACGCRPLKCHACGKRLKVGDVMAPNQGYFCHQECKDDPITLPADPETAAKIKAEIQAVGGLSGASALVEEGSDWQTETVCEGPPFQWDEVALPNRRNPT